MRMIGYRRVSTEEQADSGLGLEAQESLIRSSVSAKGWELTEVITDAGVSGSVRPAKRPGFARVLEMLESGEADGLVVAKLDRLSRRLTDSAHLLELVDSRGWQLSILDVQIDTSTAGGRLVANLMGSVNQHFRDVIAENTRAALAAKKARGERLGRPVTLPQDTRDRIARERAAGLTLRAIAGGLNRDGVPTARGGKAWYPGTVSKVLASLELDAEAGSNK